MKQMKKISIVLSFRDESWFFLFRAGFIGS